MSSIFQQPKDPAYLAIEKLRAGCPSSLAEKSDAAKQVGMIASRGLAQALATCKYGAPYHLVALCVTRRCSEPSSSSISSSATGSIREGGFVPEKPAIRVPASVYKRILWSLQALAAYPETHQYLIDASVPETACTFLALDHLKDARSQDAAEWARIYSAKIITDLIAVSPSPEQHSTFTSSDGLGDSDMALLLDHLAELNVIENLVDLAITSTILDARFHCVQALNCLSKKKNRLDRIVNSGGIPFLIDALQNGSFAKLWPTCLEVLWNLAYNESTRKILRKELSIRATLVMAATRAKKNHDRRLYECCIVAYALLDLENFEILTEKYAVEPHHVSTAVR